MNSITKIGSTLLLCLPMAAWAQQSPPSNGQPTASADASAAVAADTTATTTDPAAVSTENANPSAEAGQDAAVAAQAKPTDEAVATGKTKAKGKRVKKST